MALVSVFFAECKKKEEAKPAEVAVVDDTPEQTTAISDQSNVENESDQSMDDVNSIMDESSSRASIAPCNVSIDTSSMATGLIKLTFSGSNCANKKSRTGVINVQLSYDSITKKVISRHVAGSTISLTYVNYKVTNLADNKSLLFNGTHRITNVSGGSKKNMVDGTPIVHKIRANMQLTFDDGTVRTWSAARIRTFTSLNSVINTQLTGDTTINSYSNVAMWGTNRAGEDFSISITTPVVLTIVGGSCTDKPLSGVRVHHKK